MKCCLLLPHLTGKSKFMDHLKEMFKFQLQSLEMVGCEMLFIVASSDGEFQVYGSSKGNV